MKIVNFNRFWILLAFGTLVIMISLVFLPMMVPKNSGVPWGIDGYIWMWGFYIYETGEYMGMLLNVFIFGFTFSIIIIVFVIKDAKLLAEFRKTQVFTKKMNKNFLFLAILTIVLTVLWLIFLIIVPLGGINYHNYHVVGYGFVVNLIGGGLVLITTILMNKTVRD